jgi:molecular chaperone HscB
MNYFDLFGFPVAPVINTTLVAKKYFELQRAHHPDFFTQANEAEKEAALEQSANINKAFAVFQDQEKTLEYFLQLQEVIVTDEKYQLPPDFLMEMMELNESLLSKTPEAAADEIAAMEAQLYNEIAPILNDSALYGDAGSLQQLKAYYYQKKYLKRILDRLND